MDFVTESFRKDETAITPKSEDKYVAKVFNWSDFLQNPYFSELIIFSNSPPSASNFKSFSRSLEHFFLTVGQNNFGNKIPHFFFRLIWTRNTRKRGLMRPNINVSIVSKNLQLWEKWRSTLSIFMVYLWNVKFVGWPALVNLNLMNIWLTMDKNQELSRN